MRYRVGSDIIKSENAAKPLTQRSTYLADYLRERPRVGSALDFGAGKLRYTDIIAQRCGRLGIVDSEAQIRRTQVLGGERATVLAYAREHWADALVQTWEEFQDTDDLYDFALVANVLSAVPSQEMRRRIVREIARHLGPRGQALFVTQYRNSYFNEARRRPGARDHLDGWVLQSRRGAAFFGIIGPDRLTRLLSRNGLDVIEVWKRDGCAYALASKAATSPSNCGS